MNDQQFFDAALAHARKQKALSRGSYDTDEVGNITGCMYRGSNGRMCFVGVLIKDKHYTPELEGKIASGEAVRNALKLSGVRPSSRFLRDVQQIHDNTPLHTANKGADELLAYWEKDFKALAAKHRLVYTPPGKP
jgi:hypothetical protein